MKQPTTSTHVLNTICPMDLTPSHPATGVQIHPFILLRKCVLIFFTLSPHPSRPPMEHPIGNPRLQREVEVLAPAPCKCCGMVRKFYENEWALDFDGYVLMVEQAKKVSDLAQSG